MKDKFKEILKKENLTTKEFSHEIDMTEGSFKALMSRDKVPRWVKAFVLGYKLGNIKEIEVNN